MYLEEHNQAIQLYKMHITIAFRSIFVIISVRYRKNGNRILCDFGESRWFLEVKRELLTSFGALSVTLAAGVCAGEAAYKIRF